MSKHIARHTLFAMLVAFGFSGSAWASSPATGLGQSWPNASDLSVNPNYHAYRFVLGGITYIQINDLNGNVMGSVGTSSGQFIVLPIGKFAQLVATPQQAPTPSSGATATAAPATVYDDGTTQMTATPMSDGTTQLRAQLESTCNDPATCGTKGSQ